MKDELKNNSAPSTHNSPQAHGAAAKGQFLIYQAEDGKLKLDVRLEGKRQVARMVDFYNLAKRPYQRQFRLYCAQWLRRTKNG